MNFVARRALLSPLTFWLVAAAIALYFVMPLRKTIRFGMDLVGGTYITLEVQVDKAVAAELVGEMQAFEGRLKQARKKLPKEKNVADDAIKFTFNTVQEAQEAFQVAQSSMPDMKHTADGTVITSRFSDARVTAIKNDAVLRNIQVLKTRLDKFSVAEIPIARQGDRNIIIELPDVSNPQQAKEMIGRAALLEFRLVDKEAPTEADLLYELDGMVPSDKEILSQIGDDGREHFYLVQKYATVTGRHVRDAKPAFGGANGIEPIVAFNLTREGGDLFYELTSKNFNRPLAIVLDGQVISVAQIKAAIRESGTITGNFTSERARTLAMLLKSGAFVAPVTFEQERQIGPSLGAESISKGLYSCLAGLGLLLVFSIAMYKVAGIFAFLALLFNLVLVLIGMALLQATLTLPGIAGMILTVGMAIDASILIFEHIRERLRVGIPFRKAVDEGFSGALRVILDANITTFIVGVVLYHFGTGPIQGFAVTMMLGIVATLIAGLFFLRALFNFALNVLAVQQIKI
jgi:preprotein translocase subunit SecD